MSRMEDLAFMEMAYGLAEKAKGRSSPNPLVGSLIVKNGAIIGHGYHKEAGEPHAEILALKRAGSRAKGATIYVTLEPCVHWGRTPPCVDALLQAGLKRAVISTYDSNPLVRKKGVRKLRKAGLEVDVGLLAEKNARMNEAYVKYITRKAPFVTLKAALSWDGKIASHTRDSKWISAEKTRDYVHLLRGEFDALMVGINTLLGDDPLLTVRHKNWGSKKIARVILDSTLRFSLKSRILTTLGKGKIVVFAGRKASVRKAEALGRKGVDVIRTGMGRLSGDLPFVLEELGKREISSLLVEGGSRLLTSFIEGGLADKLVLTLSPKLIGGRQAPGFFEGKGITSICEAFTLDKVRIFRLDGDLILEGYF